MRRVLAIRSDVKMASPPTVPVSRERNSAGETLVEGVTSTIEHLGIRTGSPPRQSA